VGQGPLPRNRCSVERLYFRFWEGPGEVSAYVCPIRATPHYRFALAFLQNLSAGRHTEPEGTGYGRYARWEAECFGRLIHSPPRFAAAIRAWLKGFDLEHNPLAVVEFRSSRYSIADGAHRAAYAAARMKLTAQVAPLPVELVVQPAPWPGVRGVRTIERGAPHYLQR
jgi:hypothetical protein